MTAQPIPGPRSSPAGWQRVAVTYPFAATLGLLALTALVFLAAPGLDLAVSGFFYRQGTGFVGDRAAIIEEIRAIGTRLEWTFVITTLVPLAIKLALPDTPLLLRPRTTLFTLASFALGPGLVVNAILKDHWGRARPRDLLAFGGHDTFSPVWWISDQCRNNCSFASGEAGSAFWLVAIVFLVPATWRLPAAAASLTVALVVSFARLAAGGHFLSDILTAWLLVFLVILVCRAVILEAPPPAFDTAIETGIARIGHALRRLLAWS
jgi:membrane-associated PAP2 superfamily phosphatase